MSEQTKKNIRAARSHSMWAGPWHIEYKFRTGVFLLLPKWERMTTEFWQEGPVDWFRAYWLTFGFSAYRTFPDRRMRPSSPYMFGKERRSIHL